VSATTLTVTTDDPEVMPDTLPAFDPPESIGECRNKIERLGRTRAEHRYLLGRLFLWAKATVPHGEFMAFVKSTAWFSHATAERMMTYARECDGKIGNLQNSPADEPRAKKRDPVMINGLSFPDLRNGVKHSIRFNKMLKHLESIDWRVPRGRYPTGVNVQLSIFIAEADEIARRLDANRHRFTPPTEDAPDNVVSIDSAREVAS